METTSETVNYNLFAAFSLFVAAVVFFVTGNTALGAVFVAVGAVFVTLTYAKKDGRDGKDQGPESNDAP